MKWNNGDVVHGFNIMKVDHVEEVNSDVYMMEHIKSGAKLMYLDSADDNKVFISVSARHRIIQKERRILWNILLFVAQGSSL